MSDGTNINTVMLKDINTSGDGYPAGPVVSNDNLLFAATDGVSGYELWKSDGTELGTTRVADINPTGSSAPQALTVVGDRVFFKADDGVSGLELWVAEPINTPAVSGVAVPIVASDGNTITVTFDDITVGGYTRAVRIDCDTVGPLPSEFRLCTTTPVCYDITTTAVFSSSGSEGVRVCIDISGFPDCAPKKNDIELGHDQNLDGEMQQITDPSYPSGDILCGTTSHLSPFVMMANCAIDMVCPDPIFLETGPGAVDCGLLYDPPPATAEAVCGLAWLSDPPESFFPVGVTTVVYEAEDDHGNTESCSSDVDVADTTAPEVESGDEILACLDPPNHKLRCFERTAFTPTVWDNCPGVDWQFAGCTSDQPDDGHGDGHTNGDCVVDPAGEEVCARSERSGSERDGRSYLLDGQATDAAGNTSGATPFGRLFVPHDQRSRGADECR